ncbi:testis-expressed protein 33 isoform X2 [Myripristis murdjan]|nr:testis-expressed protein 33 isoform X2 [Myripristis murdjan]XP_029914584.1 testis-expressed protein 33 isoform X2 [Myripristis murdjan]
MTSLSQKETTAKTQVGAVESPQVPPLLLPHYDDPESAISSPHSSYHSMSHCLRTNVFPGPPFTWKSHVSEFYIRHPLPAKPTDPDRWYGRKTNEMVQWTERNFVNQRLNKMLKEMEDKGTAK